MPTNLHSPTIRLALERTEYKRLKHLLDLEEKTLTEYFTECAERYLARHPVTNSPLRVDVRDDTAK